MRKFGKAEGGGRRSAPRSSLPLTAFYSTISKSASAAVADISCTGVRLVGARLPSKGDLVEIAIDTIGAFGMVVWARNGACGIAFDTELARFDVENLRRRAG
jgi:hypothetical protein